MASISNLPPRGVLAAEMLWRKAQSFRQDPLGFVLWAYAWGKPGPLEKYDGPDEWQAEFSERAWRGSQEAQFHNLGQL